MVDMWKVIERMEKHCEAPGAVELCALADQLEEKGGKYNLRVAAGLRAMVTCGVWPDAGLENLTHEWTWAWYACPNTEACAPPAQIERMRQLKRPKHEYTGMTYLADAGGGVWEQIVYRTLRQALTAWALTVKD
jgi:hypothetical protein